VLGMTSPQRSVAAPPRRPTRNGTPCRRARRHQPAAQRGDPPAAQAGPERHAGVLGMTSPQRSVAAPPRRPTRNGTPACSA
jgi:hypothetical protein